MTLVRLGVLLLLCIGPEVHPAPGPQVWVPPFPSAGGYPAAAPPFPAPAVPVSPLEYVPAPALPVAPLEYVPAPAVPVAPLQYPAAVPAPALPVVPMEYVPAPEVQGPGMLEGMIEAGKVSKYNIISLFFMVEGNQKFFSTLLRIFLYRMWTQGCRESIH